MRTSLRIMFLVLVMASTIGCDRVTKHMATALLADKPTQTFFADSVRLVYAENTGGFLRLGAGLPPVVRASLFTVMTGLVLVVLLVIFSARTGRFGARWVSRCSLPVVSPIGSTV
jgi:signal peptidase II